MNVANYFHTIRYLRREQIFGVLLSRAPFHLPAQLSVKVRPTTGIWVRPILSPPAQTGPARFQLATGTREVDGADGWNDGHTPKLWLYNLHYFDDLIAAGAESRRMWHVDLIERWLRENPPGVGVGWDSYPTSCRIVNWVKYGLGGGCLSGEAIESLGQQGAYLRRNLEWRLMANHLFANLKALVYASCYLSGPEPDEWRRTSLRLLENQVDEQILRDGGHCEQSPMYHTIVLADLLDLINIAQAFPGLVPVDTREQWRERAAAMFTWLDRMCHPDGKPAFFSDGGFASFGPDALVDYAHRLGVPVIPPPRYALSHLQESGYVRLEGPATVVIFDVGGIGLNYQPGHGHSDMLSFELSHHGRRILVNPGTSTYTDCPERHWQRGTASHNTLEVDGENQSELWGAFRVARRAQPFDVRTEDTPDLIACEGAHNGYRRLKGPVVHRRRLELAPRVLDVFDSLEGSGTHNVKVRFHVHPDFHIEEEGARFHIRNAFCGITIEPDVRLATSVEPGTYNPRFGISQSNQALCCSWAGNCPVSFRTRIELL